MSKIIIVGAGLSGMTAGINLARDGYEVEIWDRGNAIGGVALEQEAAMKKPVAIADMTPFDIERLSLTILVLISCPIKKKTITSTILPRCPLLAFIYQEQNATCIILRICT